MSDAQNIGADDPDDRAQFDAIVAASGLGEIDATRTQNPARDTPPSPHLPAQYHQPAEAEPTLPALPHVRPKPTYGRPDLVVHVGFAMSVAMAALGQVLFLREWFGGGVPATVGAVFLAAFLEVTMIGTGNSGLDRRVSNDRGWPLLLAISAGVMAFAVVVQVLHWLPNISIAAMFAAASLVGWTAHIATGWIKANGYLDEKADRNAEIERRNRKIEARADATYERELAEVETTEQATTRAVVEQETRPKPKNTAKPAKPAKDSGKPRPDRGDVLAWAQENQAGSQRTHRHFTDQGYHLPESTARSWLNGA